MLEAGPRAQSGETFAGNSHALAYCRLIVLLYQPTDLRFLLFLFLFSLKTYVIVIQCWDRRCFLHSLASHPLFVLFVYSTHSLLPVLWTI
jgi:hypothetical protein